MTHKNQTPLDAYIIKNGLHKILDFNENHSYQKKATDTISGKFEIPFPPEKEDLIRLHKLIRTRKPFTVLEFGVGYSTAIIADALAKNQQDWLKLKKRPETRNRYLFKLFSIDASKHWINYTETRLPKSLKKIVTFHHSGVSIGQFRDQVCHYYDKLPDIVPDFVYLDAPDTHQVRGNIHGLSFQCNERTVMAADLLLMESTLLPGTFILVDGRTNNARFLARNFQRQYRVKWDQKNDVTIFELMEKKLGKYNFIGKELY